MGERLNRCLRV